MGLFDDLSRFLEMRLDEFLRAHPHLELMALEEQLRGQEEDAIHLLGDLKQREKQLEEGILATAQEIQRWHGRIEKAKAANRQDLVKPAQEREAALLRQGNHLWGQMKGVKQQLDQTRQLQQRIHHKRAELKTKIAQAEAQRASQQAQTAANVGWNQSPYKTFSHPSSPSMDPLEETFRRWETEEELDELKRQMGK
ncbi:phage shock protein A (IM30) [Halomicronema hongdechloris C2206]|uniref:Phage shock protein A (IM30) n=1 Tax=Halomicronema hongdechloris C2206 TaxID=1641165 RepID=A0A1Z3HI82_9CYAN|nr:TIGR04376 family protein [Halomicronema hongdechloris]ASC69990.1 phage shock protein A (IM30) [Halomicronema hongdechloris C2206]